MTKGIIRSSTESRIGLRSVLFRPSGAQWPQELSGIHLYLDAWPLQHGHILAICFYSPGTGEELRPLHMLASALPLSAIPSRSLQSHS